MPAGPADAPATSDASTDDDTPADEGTPAADDGAAEDPAGASSGVPAEYDGVLAAIDLAVAEHDGAPAFEVDDGDGGTWEVHLAAGDDVEVYLDIASGEVLQVETD